MPVTFDSINTHTFSGSTNTLTFSSIPQTFTDLFFIAQFSSSSNTELQVRYNGDNAANYGRSVVEAANNTTNDFYQQNQSAIMMLCRDDMTTQVTHILNYANTSYWKQTLSRFNNVSAVIGFQIAAWRQTAAISSMTIYTLSGVNFTAGSTMSLYGIKAA